MLGVGQMGDTRALLNRISSFRERLERTPHLVAIGGAIDEPDAAKTQVATRLADNPALLGLSLRSLTGASTVDGPLPDRLMLKARQLLEQARGLVAVQRQLGDEPLLAGLASDTATQSDPLVCYHRETISLTEAALRMVQAFPGSAEVQLRFCEGLDTMLQTVRDRLAVLQAAVSVKRRDADRIDGLARRLTDMTVGRAVDLAWFGNLGEQLLEEARQATPLRFLYAAPESTCSYSGGLHTTPPARFVAAHAITVAQVVARIVPHDFEWASRPLIPMIAALMMDVGMLRVPATVLGKTTPLDAAERRMVEAHPTTGANLIRGLFPEVGHIADAIAMHHERPDGTGYPNAIPGDNVLTLARLLNVCDHYAGLASERPHRPARDPRTALTDTLFAAESGRVDRDFSEYLLHLSFHPIGTVVELADGRIGVVIANHTSRANLRATARPVVAVLADPSGTVLPRPEFVDLAASERGSVVRILTASERTKLLARQYPELCA